MFSHALIVGGTGMLRAASLHLAAQSHRLTSVARTHRSLASMDKSLPERHGSHHMLPLDWSNPDAFVRGIEQHIDSTEPPDMLLAWIHDEGLAIDLASRFGNCPLRFFHVIGSASSNPAHIAAKAVSRPEPSSGVT
jgi:NAD(P)-dependent dehydrogenase (short-subunit alcohol dehydrogenase family)